MNRHDIPGVSAEDVARAHLADLAVEAKHSVRFLTYWFDPDRAEAFCLAQAPTGEAMTAVSEVRGSLPRRQWEHRIDFVRAVVWGQFRTEFDQYFLGWLWWILEPVMQSLTFLFIVALFFHFEGNRLWVILVSVVAWRWFARSVEIAPHLPLQFNPYVRTGAVTGELLFFTFLAKETVVFVIAMTVIAIPVALFNGPFGWSIAEVPLIMLTQFLVIYWTARDAFINNTSLDDRLPELDAFIMSHYRTVGAVNAYRLLVRD